MIAIINYEAGNLASVSNALKRLDEEHIITDKQDELNQADGIIFPGVGHAEPAMKSLQKNELDTWLKQTQKPVLGICLGMQLFFESSEEGDSKGLGVIPGRLKKFDSSKAKVPHMGWNTFDNISDHPIAENLSEKEYFYYVHSFYAPVNDFTVASCHYIEDFSAIVARNNFVGVQFHPEKSGKVGSLLLQNFLQFVN
ncbi:imidazole glycerol phosphate synthase subunit HisH [Aliifodinibius salipaludis]|uniref:Imidazole glycerol phosphate synthase subunit HisH n=1 Tax=Fodinibius salipaludis TaxID=2032627 RepID=A0A2A2G7D1_9BACT|nr:imidazole glycerol phosphate synthase subunit HisH [Aliifodinibius salipaludis]PAU93666.1 imidazole glycerol phosphate synthase subunit HisH [Aliifodinibius salipaludis]